MTDDTSLMLALVVSVIFIAAFWLGAGSLGLSVSLFSSIVGMVVLTLVLNLVFVSALRFRS